MQAVLVGLKLIILGKDVLALLDTGAADSFVSPRLVDEVQLQPQATKKSSGQGMEVDQEKSGLSFRVGSFYTSDRFLLAPVPYPIVLGSDWLQGLGAVWDFGSGRLYVRKKKYEFELQLIKITITDLMDRLMQIDEERRQARGAHAQLMESVTRLRRQAASPCVTNLNVMRILKQKQNGFQ